MRSYFSVLLLILSNLSFAETKTVRWTGFDDTNAEFAGVLKTLAQKTGFALTEHDFQKLEERDMATSHYVYYAQVGNKIPLRRRSLQIWSDLNTKALIQVESTVDTPLAIETFRALSANAFLSSQATMAMVQQVVKSHLDDKSVRGVTWEDYWDKGALVRGVKVKGRRGNHHIEISVQEKRVLSQNYEEFPQSDTAEFSLPVKVYPIYEEIEGDGGKTLPRIDSQLNYLSANIPAAKLGLYDGLKTQHYFDNKYNPVLGLTEEGRKLGFWSMAYIKLQAADILSKVPLVPNSFSAGPVVLEGRYASVNLAPTAPAAFKEINFVPGVGSTFHGDFVATTQDPQVEEMIPTTSLRGKPLMTATETLERPAHRLPDHNPGTYLNEGFDELQVYWSINRLFDALRPMGFTDPELSSRRFNAFLFDPDISMRNNAYYTEDTINFTTYSAELHNMARDNTTIWHELGHGVMDRLMGPHITLADTGGLSEGMADFVAQLVINDVTNTETFPGKEKMRVINNTGFNLTNEVHDDGEAYGGSMNDMLAGAIKQYGRAGLSKIADLTMEAMRLSRNNPALTANGWFNHMLFADKRGNLPIRAPGELQNLLFQALANRNFNLNGSGVASYSLKNGDAEVVAGSPGSRQLPIRVDLAPAEKKTYRINLSLKSSDFYRFQYPVKVKVQLKGGPIQGAIAWEGKATEPHYYEIKADNDVVPVDLTVTGKCDEFNRPDKSCVDFAYIQIFNKDNSLKPVAKKRFYLRLYPKG